MIDVNKIDLEDRIDQVFYTTEDIVIPKGSFFCNWSTQDKAKGNIFAMDIGFGSDAVATLRITPGELEEILKYNSTMFSKKKPRKHNPRTHVSARGTIIDFHGFDLKANQVYSISPIYQQRESRFGVDIGVGALNIKLIFPEDYTWEWAVEDRTYLMKLLKWL